MCVCVYVCVPCRSRVASCSWVRSRGPLVSVSAVNPIGPVLVWTDELLGYTY